jgi:hypothetical protein
MLNQPSTAGVFVLLISESFRALEAYFLTQAG